MQRTMLKSTIHRATVTQANLHHVGSLTIDQDLMDAADLLAGEQVAVVDVTNGARLDTHVVPGDRGSGVIGVNGAAAYLIAPGDLVVVSSYGVFDDADARAHEPLLVLVDADNRTSDPATGAADDPAGDGAASAADDADGAPAETDDAARLDALIQAGA